MKRATVVRHGGRFVLSIMSQISKFKEHWTKLPTNVSPFMKSNYNKLHDNQCCHKHHFLIFEIKSSTLTQYFKDQILLHKSIYFCGRNFLFYLFLAYILYKTSTTLYRILMTWTICTDSDWSIIIVLYDLHRILNCLISAEVH